jgi:hypothetical protein
MTDDEEKREMGKMANRTEVTFCKKKKLVSHDDCILSVYNTDAYIL